MTKFNDEVIELCFTETASRLQGVGFKVLAEEMLRRHELGFPGIPRDNVVTLPNPGEYHWRAGAERHMWAPPLIASIQSAAGRRLSRQRPAGTRRPATYAKAADVPRA